MHFIWTGLLGASMLAPVAQADCHLGAVAVLSMDGNGAPFVVNASVNGQPVRLRVDTGSTTTTINRASAERLKIDFHPGRSVTYGLGGVQQTDYGFADTFKLGGITANQWRLAGRNIWPAGPARGLDGYLAMDMLSTYDIDLDVPGHHLIIYKPSGLCFDPTVSIAQPLYATPLVLISGNRQPDIEIVVDGQHLRALLDSGVARSFMFRGAAERLGLDLAPLRASDHIVKHGIGPRDIAIMPHVFASVSIGGLTFKNMPIDVLDQMNAGNDRHRTGSLLAADTLWGGHDVTLGADFLSKVHVWISHSSHQVIMQYPPQPSTLPN